MDKTIRLHNAEESLLLLGRHDENIRLVESELGVGVVCRGENLIISGEEEKVSLTAKLFEELLSVIRMGGHIHKYEVAYAIKNIQKLSVHSIYLDKIDVMSKRQFITPKSMGQKDYVDAIREYDIVFGIGPAGTGKTYLAMAMAVSALKNQQVSRIILTRPAVEAGENLGFLPGDMYEKVSPYLRPLYDALYEMMEVEKIQKFIDRGIIEVAPLAFMRGRTLNDSFIILDEAQNSTPEQMQMFLTRLGFDSKAVITGDITQVDLPSGKESGLIQVQSILKNISGIKFAYFSPQDVVRHELVQDIIHAYANFKQSKNEPEEKK